MTEATAATFDAFWDLYARAFVQPFESNGLLSEFVANPTVTGAFAEAYTRSMIKKILGHRFRISTGAVIRPLDKTRVLRSIPQCDVIVWDPSELPAIFECGEFALVPFHSVRAIIEVKRTGCKKARALLADQLKERLGLMPTMSAMDFVLGVLANDDDPEPLFNDERRPSPNWLQSHTGTPPITRILHNGKADTNGIMAFIYFLAQVAQKRLARGPDSTT